MLVLGGRAVSSQNLHSTRERLVLRVETTPTVDHKSVCAFLLSADDRVLPDGFAAYLQIAQAGCVGDEIGGDRPAILLPPSFSYLAAGDIFSFSIPENRVRVLYRRRSRHNNFLVTERCDNYCLMCSQPPKQVNDDWIIEEILQALPLIDPQTEALGFTGGEPTLLGDRFIDVLSTAKNFLPATALHVLSNGRRFSDRSFTAKWANVRHPDLMVGIPLYSDLSTVHDFVVQADGAYDQTVRGILNLKELGQSVEIRVVLHRETYRDLRRLAEFITRNLLFVDHVALMGLEIIGFARANLDTLWIDPLDYQKELFEAVQVLDAAGVRVSIYNLPMCLLDRRLWPFARQSISDWKNEYLPQCAGCDVRDQCAGFFFSAKYRNSNHITPIRLTASPSVPADSEARP